MATGRHIFPIVYSIYDRAMFEFSAGPWARASLPGGRQSLDVLVTGRERTADGQWWYACQVLLPCRYQHPDGTVEEKAAPTDFDVSAEHITPIPGEDYSAVPTLGAVAGRQWLVTRIRMQQIDGPAWCLHRRDCWQATGEQQRITTAEAVDLRRGQTAAECDVCRPDRALPA